MKSYNGYSIADLTESQIDMVNNTQQSLEQNSEDDIVLIAYKKDKK